MAELPGSAAWRHVDAREGLEVVFIRAQDAGLRVEGHVSAVEDRVAWSVRYELILDEAWRTRSAHVSAASEAGGRRDLRLTHDGAGGWRIAGEPAPHLAGLPDVDLEASAFTNAIPLRRMRLDVGAEADASAAYVRAPDLRVERLEQRYGRLPDEGGAARYDYSAPAFDFNAVLAYDEHGLVLEYPGIAVRVL